MPLGRLVVKGMFPSAPPTVVGLMAMPADRVGTRLTVTKVVAAAVQP